MRRAKIRAKLDRGELPKDLPNVSGFGRMTGIRFGVSEGTLCSACDARIKQGEMMVDYTYASGRVLCFHEECRLILEEERLRA